MSAIGAYWEQLLAVQSAALPAPELMQVWLRLGWGLVLAALLVGGVAWLLPDKRLPGRAGVLRAAALALVLFCALPGEWSPAYWLGLGFQAPSLSAAALALLVLLRHGMGPQVGVALAADVLQQARRWAPGAVLMGWVLLLDTFAFWPLALYPLGFGGLAWVLLLAVVLAPWAWAGGPARAHAGAGVWVLALLVFAALRLPSGNVWDAVLDPWLWLLCHALLLVQAISRYKKRSY